MFVIVTWSAQVSLGGVGKIYKIRLELLSQDVNSKPSWKVKTVSDCMYQLIHGPPNNQPVNIIACPNCGGCFVTIHVLQGKKQL